MTEWERLQQGLIYNDFDEDLFERRIIAKPCVGCTKGDNRKHNGIYCIIKDWETHRNIRFVDMVFGGGK